MAKPGSEKEGHLTSDGRAMAQKLRSNDTHQRRGQSWHKKSSAGDKDEPMIRFL
jgi:hypothetical protein